MQHGITACNIGQCDMLSCCLRMWTQIVAMGFGKADMPPAGWEATKTFVDGLGISDLSEVHLVSDFGDNAINSCHSRFARADVCFAAALSVQSGCLVRGLAARKRGKMPFLMATLHRRTAGFAVPP